MAEPVTTPARIIVIGNGVVGMACAIALQRRGVAVTLVSPEPVMRGASWGNAGHIATEQAEPLASRAMLRSFGRRLFLRGGPLALPPAAMGAWAPFALRLMRASAPVRFGSGKAALGGLLAEAMPAWRRLLSAAGAPELLREDGHFVVWETERTAREGRARWERADTGLATFRDATAAELADLRALTRAPLVRAIRFVGTGQIRHLDALADRLAGYLAALGGQYHVGRVARLTEGGSAVALEDGTSLTADSVLVAAGAMSGTLVAPLGLRAPMIAERGYHIQSADGIWPLATPPVVFEDRAVIVTRFISGLRAASFVEFGRVDAPPDPRKAARLRAHVAALGLPFPEPITEWMGARPTLPDYLPAIGRSAAHPALTYAFGHQHLGLTLAAVTGEAVAAMLTGKTSAINLQPFDLSRFR